MQRERSTVCGMENGVQHGTPINFDYLAESLGLVQPAMGRNRDESAVEAGFSWRAAREARSLVRQDARHMPHFATGSRLRLAVKPQRCALFAQNGLVIEDIFADEIAHFDRFAMAAGRS